jgi:hypothetical protein
MQSPKHSFIEALVQNVVGYFMALLTQILIFPLFGYHMPLSQNAELGLIFTVVSIARSYVIRRLFNRRHKLATRPAQGRSLPCSNLEGAVQEPVFESASGRILNECLSIGTQRGGEYADTWHEENLVTALTEATLARLGVKNVDRRGLRLLLLAALVDVKQSRIVNGGPHKLDSYIDKLNYEAAYAALRDDFENDEVRWALGPDPSTV